MENLNDKFNIDDKTSSDQLLAKKLKEELIRRNISFNEDKVGKSYKRWYSEGDSTYKSKINKGIADAEDWLVTYADVITLMLTLFVLLFSYSKVDQKKFEQLKQSINKELLKKEEKTMFDQVEKNVKSIFDGSSMGNKVLISSDPKGLRIELNSSALYDLGSAEIKPDMLPELRELAHTINTLRINFPNYLVEIEGHTDNIPINTPQYPSNWELSTNRATNIVKLFIEEGIPPNRLRAAGYADSRPKLPNTDINGNPIPQNQAANRRVVIFIQRDN
jgi:chemotaxis protein MotB